LAGEGGLQLVQREKKEKRMKQVDEAIKAIKECHKVAFESWQALEGAYTDPNYDEDFEDTLQRKYDEGASAGLAQALEILGALDLMKIRGEISILGAQECLEWLEEVYGEGIKLTGAWQTYMKEEEGAAE